MEKVLFVIMLLPVLALMAVMVGMGVLMFIDTYRTVRKRWEQERE